MSSFDCEGNIVKDEKVATEEPANETKPATAVVEVCETFDKTSTKEADPTNETPTIETVQSTLESKEKAKRNFFNSQFQQKTRLLRQVWTENHKLMQMNRNHSNLIIIIFLSIISIIFSVLGLVTNSWTCSSNTNKYFGLWNTCYKPYITETSDTLEALMPDDNSTGRSADTVCAHQGLYDVEVIVAEQSRIDQVSASQGLIVCGTFLYIISLITIALAYKFIHVNNLNSVRNALVTSMCVQLAAFFMLLIGFFLFILTERVSISVTLLFVYFGLAIFATNIINFITIEYKTFKARQLGL